MPATAAHERSRAPADDAGQAGFTLLGLMIVIAVINIALGVAVTSWMTLDKRAKEAELIWRGQQYVRALACHRQQEGAPPEELEDLLESDCIRALYPDPMTPDGQWRVIRESDLQNRSGFEATTQGRNASEILDALDQEMGGSGSSLGNAGAPGRGGATGGRGAGAGGVAAPNSDAVSESLRTAYERLRNLTERLRQDFGSGSGNGIVGVVSRSTDEALRLYEGETTYDAWQFLAR